MAISSKSISLIQKKRKIISQGSRAGVTSWYAARIKELEEVVAWYGEQARLARLIHSEGDIGRHALALDGGKRARQILSADDKNEGDHG